jgi:mevalonate kinase
VTSDPTAYRATARERTESDDRPIGEVFSAVTADLSTLIRQEVALAKAEIRQSATQAGAGAGKLAGAGVAGHFVLLFVSISAWWGLGQFIGNAWSALVIAAFWAIVGAVLYTSGRTQLKQVEGLPSTTETAKQIPPALAGHEETS